MTKLLTLHQLNQNTRPRTLQIAKTDILVIPEVVESNRQKIAERPKRKHRRRDYAKKIMNDPFIFGV